MNEINTCPWCSEKEPTASAIETGTGCWVACGKCGACGPFTVCKQDAISAWNTRATAAPVVVGEDTKRLDWLATQFRTCTVYMNGSSLYKPGTGIQSLVGQDFRSAIDAAMEAALAGD